MSLVKKVMFFIDGENLVMRYQEMVHKEKRNPLNGILHAKDVYVWHDDMIRGVYDILRVTYYTSTQGSSEKILDIKNRIQNIQYRYRGESEKIGGRGNIFPKVYHKLKKSAKTRIVDINMTIDMLNFASMDNVDRLYLVSGDGDFIPLIKEIMQKGKQVHVMALSSGLDPELPVSADSFEIIDSKLFKKLK